MSLLLKREPFYIDSAKVWTYAGEELADGFIAAITVNNLYCIVKKLKSMEVAGEFVDQLLDDFNVVELTKDTFQPSV